MSDLIRIAVISDIHAFNSRSDGADKDVSHLDVSTPDNEPNNHPLSGLLKLIEKENLQASMLISAGDVCDKACPVSFKYVWDKIQIIKEKLKCSSLVSTAGNHDLDSRHKHNDYDAKGFILSLNPLIPIDDEALCNKFWAKNYVLYIFQGIRFLIINTSAYHGGQPDEIMHGRLSANTLQAIRVELDADASDYKFNVLLCHHHPLKHDELGDDQSVMNGGDKLIDLLGCGQYGEWLVIHGHKHHPNIFYAPGGGSAPVVFSSGSLCANLYPILQTRVRNQFHILEIPVGDLDSIGLGICGCIYSWDWCGGVGWVPASFSSGLPYISYFGFRGPLSAVSKQIEAIVARSSDPFLRWTDILKEKEQFKYITPSNLLALIKLLERKGISITWSQNGSTLEEIGKTL